MSKSDILIGPNTFDATKVARKEVAITFLGGGFETQVDPSGAKFLHCDRYVELPDLTDPINEAALISGMFQREFLRLEQWTKSRFAPDKQDHTKSLSEKLDEVLEMAKGPDTEEKLKKMLKAVEEAVSGADTMKDDVLPGATAVILYTNGSTDVMMLSDSKDVFNLYQNRITSKVSDVAGVMILDEVWYSGVEQGAVVKMAEERGITLEQMHGKNVDEIAQLFGMETEDLTNGRKEGVLAVYISPRYGEFTRCIEITRTPDAIDLSESAEFHSSYKDELTKLAQGTLTRAVDKPVTMQLQEMGTKPGPDAISLAMIAFGFRTKEDHNIKTTLQ